MNQELHHPDGPRRYRFGDALLDADTRSLDVAGQARHLEPRAFELLCLLLAERARVVPKEELLDRIWPGRIVVEGALKRAIGLIRKALGDDPGAPRYIRTVHGVGYQFVAEVEALPAAATRPVAPMPQRRRWPVTLAAAVVITLLLILGYANLWRDVGSSERAAVRALILPFDNLTGDAQLDWVGRGLPALVAHALIEEPGLRLVEAAPGAHTAQALGIGFDSPLGELARLRELFGVDFLVLGQVAGEPQAWRLDLRLLDAADRLEVHRFDANDLTALATDHGFHALRVALLGNAASGTMRQLSTDPFINETYARASAARASGDSLRARELLAVVLREAPDDLHARMDLVEVEHRLGKREELADLLQPVQVAVAAEPASALALRLYTHLGNAAEAAGNRAAARAAFERVFEIASQRGDLLADANALRLLGRLAGQDGDWEEAEALLGRALTAFTQAGYEPGRALALGNLALVYWRRGMPLESRRHYELALSSFREQGNRAAAASMLGNLANIERELGETEHALAHYEEALATHRELGNRSSELHTLINLQHLTSTLGRDTEARAHAHALLAAADALGDPRHAADARVIMAGIASADGDSESAGTWYEAAAERYLQAGLRDYLQVARARQIGDLADAGSSAAARHLYQQHRDLLEEDTGAYARSQVLAAEAALATAEGRIDAAIAHLEAGRELALGAGLSSNANWFTAQIAHILLRAGRLDRAEQWVGRVDDLDGSFIDALRVRARHAYERGDYMAALDWKQRLRERAGDAWRDDDQTRLDAYHEAAVSGTRVMLGDELF